MSDKARTIIKASFTASGTYNYVHTACDMTQTNASNTLSLTKPTHVLTEVISSGSGRQRPNPCHHRIKTFKVHTDGDGPYKHGAVVNGKHGVTQYSGYSWAPIKSDKLSLFNGWHVYGTPVGTDVPTRWMIDGVINEQKLKEDVLNKARGLKADVLLNAVEANQAWPALQSLFAPRNPVILERGWKKIRRLIRQESGAYLAWKFGISPILSDITRIWKYLPTMADDLKRHSDREKQRYSAKAGLVASYDSTPILDGPQNGYSTLIVYSQGRASRTPVVRYVLVVKPKQMYHTRLFSDMAACMSRFATGPASLAWEKVPWSFVVDWFVDLRGVLRLLDDSLSSPPYEVVSFTRSYSYLLETDVSLTRFSPCDGSIITDTSVGTVSHDLYERSVVDSKPSWPTLSDRFGKNQAAISAALIAQYLTGAKRPKGRGY